MFRALWVNVPMYSHVLGICVDGKVPSLSGKFHNPDCMQPAVLILKAFRLDLPRRGPSSRRISVVIFR